MLTRYDAFWRTLTRFDGFEELWYVLRLVDRLTPNHLTCFFPIFQVRSNPVNFGPKIPNVYLAFSDRCCQEDNGYRYFFDITSFDNFFNNFEFSDFPGPVKCRQFWPKNAQRVSRFPTVAAKKITATVFSKNSSKLICIIACGTSPPQTPCTA